MKNVLRFLAVANIVAVGANLYAGGYTLAVIPINIVATGFCVYALLKEHGGL